MNKNSRIIGSGRVSLVTSLISNQIYRYDPRVFSNEDCAAIYSQLHIRNIENDQ